MANPEFVAFADAEAPLIQAGLRPVSMPEHDSGELGHLRDVGIVRNAKNGWIYFDFPFTPEDWTVRGQMQVWTGTSPLLRDWDVDWQNETSLKGTFAPGIIDEGKVLLAVKNRFVSAHRDKFYLPPDPELNPEALLQKGIAWILEKASETAEFNWLSQ